MDLGLGDGGGAFQEIEVASFVGLLDVLHEELAVSARVNSFFGSPGCAATGELLFAGFPSERWGGAPPKR